MFTLHLRRFIALLLLPFFIAPPSLAANDAVANDDTAVAADTDTPSLKMLLQLAEENHADFLARGFDLAVERETENVGFAALMPQLSSQWSDDNNKQSPSRDWTWSFSLSQPLFDLPAFENWRAAKEGVRLSEINYDLARRNLHRDVILAWLQAQLASDVLGLVETRRKTLREQAARAELLAAAGKTTNTDVLSARSSLANANSQWEQARHDLAVAQDALSRYTGVPSPLLWLNATAAQLPALAPLAQWQKRVEEGNLSVMATRQQVTYLKRQLRAAELSITPRVSLNGTHSLRGSVGEDQSVVGVVISQSLFTGGRFSAQRRQAVARLEAIYKRLTDTLRAQAQTTSRLHGQIQANRASMDALQEAVDTASALLESVILGYNSGVRIATEVLSAEEDVFNARLELRRAAYSYLQNLTELQNLAGGVDDAFVASVNALFIQEERKKQ